MTKNLVMSYELSWRTDEDKKFMKSAEWKNIRKNILERDDYTCQYCGVQRKTFLQINHIDGNPKDHSEENLEVICSACHKITHSGLWAVIFGILDVYEESKYSQNEIVSTTGEMRDQGKPDEEIIEFLGLKKKVMWQKDFEYLKTKFGFITSRKMNKGVPERPLTEIQQQASLKNRKNW